MVGPRHIEAEAPTLDGLELQFWDWKFQQLDLAQQGSLKVGLGHLVHTQEIVVLLGHRLKVIRAVASVEETPLLEVVSAGLEPRHALSGEQH